MNEKSPLIEINISVNPSADKDERDFVGDESDYGAVAKFDPIPVVPSGSLLLAEVVQEGKESAEPNPLRSATPVWYARCEFTTPEYLGDAPLVHYLVSNVNDNGQLSSPTQTGNQNALFIGENPATLPSLYALDVLLTAGSVWNDRTVNILIAYPATGDPQYSGTVFVAVERV